MVGDRLELSVLHVRERTLYWILSSILSQWRDLSMGVVWWHYGVLVTARAAELRTRIKDDSFEWSRDWVEESCSSNVKSEEAQKSQNVRLILVVLYSICVPPLRQKWGVNQNKLFLASLANFVRATFKSVAPPLRFRETYIRLTGKGLLISRPIHFHV